MPERDATLDAFISSSSEEDAESENEREDARDGDGAIIDDQPDAEMDGDSGEDEVGDGVDGEAVPADDGEAVPADDGEAVPADDGEAVPADDGGPESSDSRNESAPSDSSHVSELAVTTMAWSPAGEACEACGETTLRRWRTDSGFLCPSCVDWERTPNQ